MFKEEPDLIDMPILTKVKPQKKIQKVESKGKLMTDKLFFNKIGLQGILDDSI